MGRGTGSGAGGNPIWMIVWFLILIFIGFFVSGFCAGWYIILYPLTVCIESLSGVTDVLLNGIQFTHFCARHMMSGTPIGEAFK